MEASAQPHVRCPIGLCLTLTAAMALQAKDGSISQRGQLTPEQKKRRVVLKRVNNDRSITR